jgi:hypothetical protein
MRGVLCATVQMGMLRLTVGFAAALAACSGSSETRAKVVGGDGDAMGALAAAAAVVEVEVRPVGRANLDAYGWRRGPGRAAVARALAAEKKGDMAGVAREAAAALAADPGHLEAAWLVAIAKAKLGDVEGVLEPLAIAASGDWAKWGERSLVLPALETFRQTPHGQGWVRAAEQYRTAMADALAGAVVVVARGAAPRIPRPGGAGSEKVEQRAEVYAVGVGDAGRWIRLTRTGGTVAGALPAPGRAMVAYAAYDEVWHPNGDTAIRELRIGAVDLATGRAGREVALPNVHEVMLGWVTRGSEITLVARVVPARLHAIVDPPRVFAIDWRQGQKRGTDLPAPRDGLRIRSLSTERRRLPVAGVTADWDDAGTASAIRIDKSKKVVAPGGASSAMIDGHSVVWSPDGARLAFATAAEDPCGDAAAKQVAVHVVDAASGRARVVGKSAGVPSPVWLDAARLAYVDGDKEVARLAGGGGVVTSALGETRACADDSAPPPFTYAPGEPAAGEGEGEGEGDEPEDVGTIE